MGYYTPAMSSSRRANGDSPPALLGRVRNETELPNTFELDRLGIRSESSIGAPVNRGEFTFLERGGFESAYRTIVTATETYEVLVTERDIGAGEASRLTVAIDDGGKERTFDNTYNDPVEQALDSYYEAPPAPETEAYTDLSHDAPTSVETEEYVHWEPLPEEYAPADNSYVYYSEPEPYYEPDPGPTPQEQAFADALAGWEMEETDLWS